MAGGKSSRMGTNKAWLMYNNKRFIEHSLAVLEHFCQRIIISANTREYDTYGYEVVSDRFLHAGPLAGIEACLNFSDTEANLVLPCDVPGLTVDAVRHILDNANSADAVVPIYADKRVEPLVGYYAKRIHPIIVQQIERQEYSVKLLLSRISTRYVQLHNVSLWNVNSPADYWELTQQQIDNTKVRMPLLILISGTGRKVGKTRLACDIITQLSKSVPVVAVKISNHFHAVDPLQKIVVQTEYYQVIDEQLQTTKDSSRMKQAGAIHSYYIQTMDEYVFEAFQTVVPKLAKEHIIVCESNGLSRYVKPSLHFLVCDHWPLENAIIGKYPDAIPVRFSDQNCSFDIRKIVVNPLYPEISLKY